MRFLALVSLALVAWACGRRGAESTLPTDWMIAEHGEATLSADGRLEPLIVSTEPALIACVSAPPATDTSQWQAIVSYSEALETATWTAPERRMAGTVCFAAPPLKLLPQRSLELCLQLRDGYSGRQLATRCKALRVLGESLLYRTLRRDMVAVLGAVQPSAENTRVPALRALEERAKDSGFPFLAFRLRMIAAFYLRREGGVEQTREAERLLSELPAWITQPEASSWAAQAAVERSTLALKASRLEDAWTEAKEAERHFLRVASPKAFSAANKQAEILARVGALTEARHRLRAALDECQNSPCEPLLLPSAESTLAWWIAQDPTATPEEIESALAILANALAADWPTVDEQLEKANLYINRAVLEVRAGDSPEESLDQVQALIGNAQSARARELTTWAILLAATQTLEAGSAATASNLALEVAASTEIPRVAAWAWSLAARASRVLGRSAEAAAAFERALDLHQYSSSHRLGLEIPLGPGRRADDYYRAARLAIERDRPDAGWQMLQRLDEAGLHHGDGRNCSDSETDSRVRRESLLHQLVALDRPAAAPRRAQREPIRRAVLAELQEMARTGCGWQRPPNSAPEPQLRAFFLDGEIFLLARSSQGVIALERRTAVDHSLLSQLSAGAGIAELDDDAWVELTEPLARALVPSSLRTVGRQTLVAMYGPLQAVPLAALPLAGWSREQPLWFGDTTTIVTRVVGAPPHELPTAGAARQPLFVIDPSANLPNASRAADLYAQLFPAATIVRRADATRRRILERVGDANWLHVGAHGRYDPAFPELSSLVTADGELSAADLIDHIDQLVMANLSACHSGRWPITADSGRYGLAGSLSRQGVPWVVASRTTLGDRLASAFNSSFYRSLAGGASVPTAYNSAMHQVRTSFPASEWSAILLLGTADDARGGQTSKLLIPKRKEPAGAPVSGALAPAGAGR